MKRKPKHYRLIDTVNHLKYISNTYDIGDSQCPRTHPFRHCHFVIKKFTPFTIIIYISSPIENKAKPYAKAKSWFSRKYLIQWWLDGKLIDNVTRSNLPNFINALKHYHIIDLTNE
jgi:hypothetical protein